MDKVKQILQQEIDRLNTAERRDNLPRFSFTFLRKHPGLWFVMYLCYALCVALIFSTEMLGWPAFWFATAFVLGMSLLMLMDISPKYRFEDIDALDLRVCYNGEWYYIRAVSEQCINAINNDPEVPTQVKQGIARLLEKKGEVDFYDIYHLAWGGRSAATI